MSGFEPVVVLELIDASIRGYARDFDPASGRISIYSDPGAPPTERALTMVKLVFFVQTLDHPVEHTMPAATSPAGGEPIEIELMDGSRLRGRRAGALAEGFWLYPERNNQNARAIFVPSTSLALHDPAAREVRRAPSSAPPGQPLPGVQRTVPPPPGARTMPPPARPPTTPRTVPPPQAPKPSARASDRAAPTPWQGPSGKTPVGTPWQGSSGKTPVNAFRPPAAPSFDPYSTMPISTPERRGFTPMTPSQAYEPPRAQAAPPWQGPTARSTPAMPIQPSVPVMPPAHVPTSSADIPRPLGAAPARGSPVLGQNRVPSAATPVPRGMRPAELDLPIASRTPDLPPLSPMSPEEPVTIDEMPTQPLPGRVSADQASEWLRQHEASDGLAWLEGEDEAPAEEEVVEESGPPISGLDEALLSYLDE